MAQITISVSQAVKEVGRVIRNVTKCCPERHPIVTAERAGLRAGWEGNHIIMTFADHSSTKAHK